MSVDNSKISAVQALYDEVPYISYGSDFSPIFKSLPFLNIKEEFSGRSALEVGCGGGHIVMFLANFFGKVTGVDLSGKSITLAKKKQEELNIKNVELYQADLFDNEFLNNNKSKYDYILCYGVLHHTPDPGLGYSRLVKMLKWNGILCAGLYSRTLIKYRLKRKLIILMSGESPQKRKENAEKLFFKKGDARLRVSDGFMNPVVSFHSINQIFNWVKQNNLEYLGSYPPIEILKYPRMLYEFFVRKKSKDVKNIKSRLLWKFINYNTLSFLLVELIWILSGKSVMMNISAKKKL